MKRKIMVVLGTYEFHRRNFTRSGEMRPTRVRIGNFGNHFLSIVHGEQQDSIIHAIRALCDSEAAICLYGVCCVPREFGDVECSMALRQLVLLVVNESTPSEMEKLLFRVVWQTFF